MSVREQVPPRIAALLDQPVAVFGYGGAGLALSDLLQRLQVEAIFYDEVEGEHARRRFGQAEAVKHGIVLFSPAFAPDHPWMIQATEAGCLCLSELEFAAQIRRGPLMLVIGTNGKTTVAEFVTFLLKRNGRDAMSVGSSSYPLSRLSLNLDLDGVTAVCEVGPLAVRYAKSLQADTVFWTNFHEDHLDIYADLRSCFAAHWNLVSAASPERLYVGSTVARAAEEFGFELPTGTRIVTTEDITDPDLPRTSAFSARARWESLALVSRWWRDEGQTITLLKDAAEQFEIREHRLSRSATVNGRGLWNDSKASNFAATEAALSEFDAPVIWIGGGKNRGGDLQRFVERIAPKVKNAVLTGETAEPLAGIFNRRHSGSAVVTVTLQAAVQTAFELAQPGDAIVFSPGFSSHDRFSSFVERGLCFENAVLSLKTAPKET